MLTIERRDFLPDATLGLFLLDGHLTGWWSLELPWKQNQPNISCIPAGIYYAGKHMSLSMGRVFWIKDVPGREYIYIHKLNTIDDSLGCVGPGLKLGELNGLPAVLDSKPAFDEMWACLDDQFSLEIISL
jgi:hypothetical protein